MADTNNEKPNSQAEKIAPYDPHAKAPLHALITQTLYVMAFPAVCCVVALYWGVVFTQFSLVSTMTHGINLIIIIFDMVLNKLQFKVHWVAWSAGFLLSYSLFSVLAAVTNYEVPCACADEDPSLVGPGCRLMTPEEANFPHWRDNVYHVGSMCNYIYGAMNWSDPHILPVAVSAFIVFPFVLMILCCGLWHRKDRNSGKIGVAVNGNNDKGDSNGKNTYNCGRLSQCYDPSNSTWCKYIKIIDLDVKTWVDTFASSQLKCLKPTTNSSENPKLKIFLGLKVLFFLLILVIWIWSFIEEVFIGQGFLMWHPFFTYYTLTTQLLYHGFACYSTYEAQKMVGKADVSYAA